jgi:hypothetical protein
VWNPAKRERNENLIAPGSILFSDGVSNLKLYRDLYHQGDAPYDSVMKPETPDSGDNEKQTANETKNTNTAKSTNKPGA